MTNLITSQQQSLSDLRVMLADVPPVTIWFDGESDLFTTEYGPVEGHPRVQSHSANQAGRPCCHALEPPIRCELFAAEWAAQMRWQPTLYKYGAGMPVIASRKFDIVTLAFDVIGPTQRCSHTPMRLEERNKFCYKLFPFRFWDEDEVFTRALLGVWPD